MIRAQYWIYFLSNVILKLQIISESNFNLSGISEWAVKRIFDDSCKVCSKTDNSSSLWFKWRLDEIKSDPSYIEKRYVEHCHGFEDERHNVHTKRYKFMVSLASNPISTYINNRTIDVRSIHWLSTLA